MSLLFPIIFPIISPIMSLFFLLFFLLWHIIFHYFSYYFQLWQGAGIWKMARGRQQCLTQAWRNDSTVSMKNASSSALTGRHTYRMESCLRECSCTIIRIIFSIIRIICLGWPGLQSLLVRPRHCLSMYTDSVCYNELMGHQGSCQCCLKCPNSSAYMLLFHIMSLLLQLFFQLYALFQNKKSLFRLDFIADNRRIAESIMRDRCS